jgi:hypothetical protein
MSVIGVMKVWHTHSSADRVVVVRVETIAVTNAA